MNKLIFLFFVVSFISCHRAKLNQEIPTFDFKMIDSTVRFSTADIPSGKPFVLVYFSPDCKQCQTETADWLENMDKMKEFTFFFITNDSFDRLEVFDKYYNISKYKNIVLGYDYSNSIARNYRPDMIPFVVVYNKRRELKAIYGGGTNSSTLIESLNKLKVDNKL